MKKLFAKLTETWSASRLSICFSVGGIFTVSRVLDIWQSFPMRL
ncbi:MULTISPECIES: hypothetical protein [Odoribacteraceae]|nr:MULTISPECIES: hypothetical protein [Odoribacteraceae]MCQ4874424.1 hypothetical protein [Butyricimonas paravirosa]